MSQLDREEDAIVEAFDNGEITYSEMTAELRDLRNAYMDMAEEAAAEAYDREMERW